MSNTVRRRKQKESWNGADTFRKTKQTSSKSGMIGNVCKVSLLSLLVGLILYLSYLYANSPISAVIVETENVGNIGTWLNGNNSDLQAGNKILPELHGAESIAVDGDGNCYTGLSDGRIVKITNAKNGKRDIIDLTKGLDFAEGSERQGTRPHGLRLVNSKLYFADANQGVFEFNTKTEKWKRIVFYKDISPHLMYPNDLTITSDGKTMYFTDISQRWRHFDIPNMLLEMSCTSRVVEVDLTTGRINRIVRDALCTANGIELDRTETKLLVSEITHKRIAVLERDSGKLLKHVYLLGGSDNIRQSKDGGYWAPIPYFTSPMYDFITRFPSLRNLLVQLLNFEQIWGLLDNEKGVIVKLDNNFEPVRVYYDLEGKVAKFITQVSELNTGELLLGSYASNGIVKIDGKLLK